MIYKHIPGKLETGWDPIQQGIAARDKLQRVAAWRQLQGYSHQLFSVTKSRKPPVTITSFYMPNDFHIRPVSELEKRKTQVLHNTDISYMENGSTGVRTRILPASPILAPLLVIMLDQGGPGLAGVSFMAFKKEMMVFGKFDKIHRLIRDLKGAENGCCGKIFTKTKLWSAYIYSLNKRPFGSGANATEKNCLMNVFANTVDKDSPVFLKHLSSIAKAWTMPSDTPSERQAIFDKVLQMGSFRNHLSHPKLANWFAWNASAYQQMPEFFAAKMVYESQLHDQTDPESWPYCTCHIVSILFASHCGRMMHAWKLSNTNPAGHSLCMFCVMGGHG